MSPGRLRAREATRRRAWVSGLGARRPVLPPLEYGHPVVAVHPGNEAEADFLGADRFAGAGDAAIAEAFLVHLPDHVEDAAVLFGIAMQRAGVGIAFLDSETTLWVPPVPGLPGGC